MHDNILSYCYVEFQNYSRGTRKGEGETAETLAGEGVRGGNIMEK